MKRIFTLVCCFSIISMAGVAQKKSSRTAMSDEQFVDFAGQTDMVDANLGQLANRAASSETVRGYGEKLVSDQTKDFQELSRAAQEAKLDVPRAIDKGHDKTMIDPLQKLKGTSFDRRFVNEMITGEAKAIDIYKKEIQDGQNLDLRGYAEHALPVLQSHFADAQKLEKSKAPRNKG